VIFEDVGGNPRWVGRLFRDPPAWMMRHLKYRDRECQFPGCGARRFTQAHHIVWRENGGPTDLDNLILICFFHHRLVHEYGWAIRRDPDGAVG
jgi:HNH endonuclease